MIDANLVEQGVEINHRQPNGGCVVIGDENLAVFQYLLVYMRALRLSASSRLKSDTIIQLAIQTSATAQTSTNTRMTHTHTH